jgi:hypothetical protein
MLPPRLRFAAITATPEAILADTTFVVRSRRVVFTFGFLGVTIQTARRNCAPALLSRALGTGRVTAPLLAVDIEGNELYATLLGKDERRR